MPPKTNAERTALVTSLRTYATTIDASTKFTDTEANEYKRHRDSVFADRHHAPKNLRGSKALTDVQGWIDKLNTEIAAAAVPKTKAAPKKNPKTSRTMKKR